MTLESAFEQMEEVLKQQQNKPKTKVTYDPKKKVATEEKEAETAAPFDPTNAPPWMFVKKVVRERICSKCGEVDRVVVSNFELADGDVEEERTEQET